MRLPEGMGSPRLAQPPESLATASPHATAFFPPTNYQCTPFPCLACLPHTLALQPHPVPFARAHTHASALCLYTMPKQSEYEVVGSRTDCSVHDERDEASATNYITVAAPCIKRVLVNMHNALGEQQFVPLPTAPPCEPQVALQAGVSCLEEGHWELFYLANCPVPIARPGTATYAPKLKDGYNELRAVLSQVSPITGLGTQGLLAGPASSTTTPAAALASMPDLNAVLRTPPHTRKSTIELQSTMGVWLYRGVLKIDAATSSNGSHAVHTVAGGAVVYVGSNLQLDNSGSTDANTFSLQRRSTDMYCRTTVFFVGWGTGTAANANLPTALITPAGGTELASVVGTATERISFAIAAAAGSWQDAPYGTFVDPDGAENYGLVRFTANKCWTQGNFAVNWKHASKLRTLTPAVNTAGGGAAAALDGNVPDSVYTPATGSNAAWKDSTLIPTLATVMGSALEEEGTILPTKLAGDPGSKDARNTASADRATMRTAAYAAAPEGCVPAASPTLALRDALNPEQAAARVFLSALEKELREELSVDARRASVDHLEWEGMTIPDLLMRAYAEQNLRRDSLHIRHNDAVLLTFEVQDSSLATSWFGTYNVAPEDADDPHCATPSCTPRLLCVVLEIVFESGIND